MKCVPNHWHCTISPVALLTLTEELFGMNIWGEVNHDVFVAAMKAIWKGDLSTPYSVVVGDPIWGNMQSDAMH